MGLLDKFFPKPRSVPSPPPSQQPSSPSPFFRKPPSHQTDQKKSGGTSSQQPQKPTSRFQNSYYVPSDEFKKWLSQRWSSPSEANVLREKFEQYWPSGAGSFDRNSINTLKQRLWRDANYDEDLTKRKWADKLLKAIEKFEKGE